MNRYNSKIKTNAIITFEYDYRYAFCVKRKDALKMEAFYIDSTILVGFRYSFAAEIEQKQINNMSPFAIFAIVLTIAYIIYYGVTISRDLYGKKGQDNETEEIFDMGNTPEIEEATLVTETGDSFFVGMLAEQEKSSDADSSNQTEEQEEYRNPPTLEDNAPQKENEVEKQIESICQNMLAADIQSEIVMNEQQLEDYLISEQMIIFDNQRTSRGLQKVPDSEEKLQGISSQGSLEIPSETASELSIRETNTDSQDDEESGYKGKSENTESGIRDAI